MENKKQLIKNTTYQIDKPQQMGKMAIILRNYVRKNNLSVLIVGKEYILCEGWQFAGGMMGLFPRIVKVENTKTGKWLAQAEIIEKKTGQVMATGFAVCSVEESKKKTFDDYAILSMAQTRAIGKAYRNLIGWVMKMTGFESTPAEEIKSAEKTTLKTSEKAGNLLASEHEIEKIKILAKELGLDTIKKIENKTGLIINFKGMTKNQASKIYAELLKIKVA